MIYTHSIETHQTFYVYASHRTFRLRPHFFTRSLSYTECPSETRVLPIENSTTSDFELRHLNQFLLENTLGMTKFSGKVARLQSRACKSLRSRDLNL